jgi:hypothetical protein
VYRHREPNYQLSPDQQLKHGCQARESTARLVETNRLVVWLSALMEEKERKKSDDPRVMGISCKQLYSFLSTTPHSHVRLT